MPTQSKYNVANADQVAVDNIVANCDLFQLTARILVARGIDTPKKVRQFLNPSLETDWHDPKLIPGLVEVADKIEAAIRQNKRILVFGDFDVDGISATCIAVRGLRKLGCQADGLIPHRYKEGYALSKRAIERGINTFHPDLIMTVDCGISCALEVQEALDLGLEVCITDHHEPGEHVPQNVPVADCKLDKKCPSFNLAGAGVALKLLALLGQRFGDPHFWKQFSDLAALGTIGDMMPLLGENRAIVADGISRMRKTPSVALKALAGICHMELPKITATNLSFSLIPRVNASGRMGDATTAYELLMCDDEAQAKTLAKKLDSINMQRRQVEAELLEQANAQLEQNPHLADYPIIIVAGRGWHEGVKGIVASQIARKYKKPALVFTILDNDEDAADSAANNNGEHPSASVQNNDVTQNTSGATLENAAPAAGTAPNECGVRQENAATNADAALDPTNTQDNQEIATSDSATSTQENQEPPAKEKVILARGSGRSFAGINLFKLASTAEDLYENFGGHKAAIGITLPAKDLDTLRERLSKTMENIPPEEFIEKPTVDTCVQVQECTLEQFRELERLEPFGSHNPVPKMLMKNIFMEYRREIGKTGGHFRYEATNGVDRILGIYFNAPNIEELVNCQLPCDVLFEAQVDDWAGKFEAKLMTRDIIAHQPNIAQPQSAISCRVQELFKYEEEIKDTSEYAGITHMARFNTKVVGVTFENRQAALQNLEAGSELLLMREPENEFDAHAIAVKTLEGLQLGYLNHRLAQRISRVMDAGIPYSAAIKAITGRDAARLVQQNFGEHPTGVSSAGQAGVPSAVQVGAPSTGGANFNGEHPVGTPCTSGQAQYQPSGQAQNQPAVQAQRQPTTLGVRDPGVVLHDLGVNIVVRRDDLDLETNPEEDKANEEKLLREARTKWENVAASDLDKALSKELIGEHSLHSAQVESLTHLAMHKSVLTIMATGRGKSLIFHMHAAKTALLKKKASIFIYPLRALVADQAHHLKQSYARFGLVVQVLTGETDTQDRAEIYQGLSEGKIDVILTTPEYLCIHADEFAKTDKIGFLVVDEAHHIALSKAGNRPAYAGLDKALKMLGNPLVLAVTATASDNQAACICKTLGIEKLVIDSSVRENLHIDDRRDLYKREEYLASIVASGTKCIVYVNSRETSMQLTRMLRKRLAFMAPKISFYNAGLSKKDRAAIEKAFRAGELSCIVSTSAFGEGIDIPDIEHVILFHLPFNSIEFNQMSGRCGRSGKDAWVHLLYGYADARINDKILATSAPGRNKMVAIYLALREQATEAQKNGELSFNVSNAELASDATRLGSRVKLDEASVSCGIAVFRELGFLETTGKGHARYITMKEHPGRMDLQDSVRYCEGLDQIDEFHAFKRWALKAKSDKLLDRFTHPITPKHPESLI